MFSNFGAVGDQQCIDLLVLAGSICNKFELPVVCNTCLVAPVLIWSCF